MLGRRNWRGTIIAHLHSDSATENFNPVQMSFERIIIIKYKTNKRIFSIQPSVLKSVSSIVKASYLLVNFR